MTFLMHFLAMTTKRSLFSHCLYSKLPSSRKHHFKFPLTSDIASRPKSNKVQMLVQMFANPRSGNPQLLMFPPLACRA